MPVEQDTTDVIRVPLRAKNGDIKAHALVDAADAAAVCQWQWFLASFGYAVRGKRVDGRLRMALMHREILGLVPFDGLEVDHINRDRLDNRRCNLRIVTKGEQRQNQMRAGGTSKFRGVCWDKSRKRWRASIQVAGVWQHLGRFKSEETAAQVAHAARMRLMPFATD